jgi:hypothetical protein
MTHLVFEELNRLAKITSRKKSSNSCAVSPDSPAAVMRKRALHECDRNMRSSAYLEAQLEADYVLDTSSAEVVYELKLRDMAHLQQRAALREQAATCWQKMMAAMQHAQELQLRAAALLAHKNYLNEQQLKQQREVLLQAEGAERTQELHQALTCLRSKKHRRPIATCHASNAPNILMRYPRKEGTPIKS